MSKPKTVYWFSDCFGSVSVMSGTAPRDGQGWWATPRPGTARFVDQVYDTLAEAKAAALRYCNSHVRKWQQQARRFSSKAKT